jgi:hypothetical protein
MRQLKHPVRAIREPFGLAGLIVACVALVAALGGGAYAASGGLSGKQKKEVEKIVKQHAGEPGAPGTTGTNGKDGSNGKDGAAGKDGVNVTFSPASEAACPSGGSVFKAASGETTICNGETGFTETLPSGKTETGTWAGTVFENGSVPISFSVPLAVPIAEADTKVIPEGGTPPPECENPGHAGAASVENPEAKPGFLCVYVDLAQTSEVIGIDPPGFDAGVAHDGTGTTGAFVILERLSTPGEPHGKARGTWAVTAP